MSHHGFSHRFRHIHVHWSSLSVNTFLNLISVTTFSSHHIPLPPLFLATSKVWFCRHVLLDLGGAPRLWRARSRERSLVSGATTDVARGAKELGALDFATWALVCSLHSHHCPVTPGRSAACLKLLSVLVMSLSFVCRAFASTCERLRLRTSTGTGAVLSPVQDKLVTICLQVCAVRSALGPLSRLMGLPTYVGLDINTWSS